MHSPRSRPHVAVVDPLTKIYRPSVTSNTMRRQLGHHRRRATSVTERREMGPMSAVGRMRGPGAVHRARGKGEGD